MFYVVTKYDFISQTTFSGKSKVFWIFKESRGEFGTTRNPDIKETLKYVLHCIVIVVKVIEYLRRGLHPKVNIEFTSQRNGHRSTKDYSTYSYCNRNWRTNYNTYSIDKTVKTWTADICKINNVERDI